MKTLIITTALAAIIASPAFAQSYDPDLGSGNVSAHAAASQPKLYNAFGAYAQVPHGGRTIVGSFARHGGAGDPDPNIQFQLHREAEQGRW
jgi:hypothetical protein